MIKAVIFDMDGVIVDTEPLSFKTHTIMLEGSGKAYTEEFHTSMMGNSLNAVYKKIKEEFTYKEDESEFVKKRTAIFEELVETELKVIEGLIPLLENIKESGLKCAVATGNCRSIAEKIFKQLNILECFDFIICNEETKHSKPDPWVYKFVAEKLGVSPQECIVLEDSNNGILSALNAGCKVIAVNSLWRKNDEQILSLEKDLAGVNNILFH
jgi:HAD superfamily hydrolase (TIGR01509 family)